MYQESDSGHCDIPNFLLPYKRDLKYVSYKMTGMDEVRASLRDESKARVFQQRVPGSYIALDEYLEKEDSTRDLMIYCVCVCVCVCVLAFLSFLSFSLFLSPLSCM